MTTTDLTDNTDKCHTEPTLEARAESELAQAMPCKEEEDKVKAQKAQKDFFQMISLILIDES